MQTLGIETTDKWYIHMPKPVYEKGDVTVVVVVVVVVAVVSLVTGLFFLVLLLNQW